MDKSKRISASSGSLKQDGGAAEDIHMHELTERERDWVCHTVGEFIKFAPTGVTMDRINAEALQAYRQLTATIDPDISSGSAFVHRAVNIIENAVQDYLPENRPDDKNITASAEELVQLNDYVLTTSQNWYVKRLVRRFVKKLPDGLTFDELYHIASIKFVQVVQKYQAAGDPPQVIKMKAGKSIRNVVCDAICKYSNPLATTYLIKYMPKVMSLAGEYDENCDPKYSNKEIAEIMKISVDTVNAIISSRNKPFPLYETSTDDAEGLEASDNQIVIDHVIRLSEEKERIRIEMEERKATVYEIIRMLPPDDSSFMMENIDGIDMTREGAHLEKAWAKEYAAKHPPITEAEVNQRFEYLVSMLMQMA